MTYSLIAGTMTAGVFLLIALGFVLQLRIADIVNVAHGSFVVAGMYLTIVAVQDLGFAYAFAVPATVVVGTALSYLLWIVLLRRARGESHREQIIYSLLLLSIIETVFHITRGPDVQALRLPIEAWTIFSVRLQREYVIGFLVAVVFCGVLFAVFKFTSLGKSIEIAGKYPEGAAAIGLPVNRLYTVVYLTGSAMAYLAGGLIVAVTPVSPFLGFQYIVLCFIIGIAARLSFVGSVLTALVYGVGFQLLVARYTPSVATVGTYLILMLIMVVVPVWASITSHLRQQPQANEEVLA